MIGSALLLPRDFGRTKATRLLLLLLLLQQRLGSILVLTGLSVLGLVGCGAFNVVRFEADLGIDLLWGVHCHAAILA